MSIRKHCSGVKCQSKERLGRAGALSDLSHVVATSPQLAASLTRRLLRNERNAEKRCNSNEGIGDRVPSHSREKQTTAKL